MEGLGADVQDRSLGHVFFFFCCPASMLVRTH